MAQFMMEGITWRISISDSKISEYKNVRISTNLYQLWRESPREIIFLSLSEIFLTEPRGNKTVGILLGKGIILFGAVVADTKQ